MVLRLIIDDDSAAGDALTLAGALTGRGFHVGVCVKLASGRALPVTVRELTTLEHLAGGDLVVALDPEGCSLEQVVEAVALITAMTTDEVTTFAGSTWVLTNAPNRPLPSGGPLSLVLLEDHDNFTSDDLAEASGLTVVSRGVAGRDGEAWVFVRSDVSPEAVEHLVTSLAP
jgi:hypothetical protein